MVFEFIVKLVYRMYFYVLYYGIFLAVGILGFVFPFLMSTVVCFRVRLLFEIILWFVISFLLSVICIKKQLRLRLFLDTLLMTCFSSGLYNCVTLV